MKSVSKAQIVPIMIALFGVVLLLLGSACSSTGPGWRAPVETRTSPSLAPVQIQSSIHPSAKYYTVQLNDTLFSIAWRSDNDTEQLAQWNNIRSPDLIYPGQRLWLRAPQNGITKPKPKPKQQQRKPAPTPKPRSAVKSSKPPEPVFSKGKLVWRWPMKGKLAAKYKANHQLKKGIKIIGKPGTRIKAAEGGRVVYGGDGLIGYGLLVIIKHNDQYLSAYGHNRKLLVKEGQQVAKGDVIGELGLTNTGKPHLHFEIRRKGKPVNPLGLLPQQNR